MASDLERLLEAQAAEGQLESTGSFTLDPEKLREKLRRFLLPEPHAYILKLVQWAVAAGATRIKVQVRRKRVMFAHDGLQPESEVLAKWPSLLESDWQNGDDIRAPELELAFALNSVKELRPKRIRILSRCKTGTFHQVYDQEGDWQFHSKDQKGKPLAIVSIEGRRPAYGSGLVSQLYRNAHADPIGWTSDFFNSRVLLREKALLNACCGYCPIPLRVNGGPVNRPFFNTAIGGSLLAERCLVYLLSSGPGLQLLAPNYHPGSAVSAWYCPTKRHPVLEVKSGNSFKVKGLRDWATGSDVRLEGGSPANACLVAIRTPTSLSKTSRIAGVVRGVNIETDVESSLPPSTFAVLCHPGLGTDLSGLRVKKGQARRDMVSDFAKRMDESYKRRRKS